MVATRPIVWLPTVTVGLITVTVNASGDVVVLDGVADSYVAGNAPGNNYGIRSQLAVDGFALTRSFLLFAASSIQGTVTSFRWSNNVYVPKSSISVTETETRRSLKFSSFGDMKLLGRQRR